jgi:serine/threonine-protein kinase
MLRPEAVAPVVPAPAATLPEPTPLPPPAATTATPAPAAGPAPRAAAAPRSEVAPRAAASEGIVQLAVSPWAEVLVDGRARGVSPPLTEIELSPGRHVIELRNPGADPVVRRVDLRAGEKLRIQHRFGAPVPE